MTRNRHRPDATVAAEFDDGGVARVLHAAAVRDRVHVYVLLDARGVIRWINDIGGKDVRPATRHAARPTARGAVPPGRHRARHRRDPEPGSAEACGHAENDRWTPRGNRSAFWATGATTAIRDASGEPIGYLKSLRNRTVIREHTLALRNERDALAGARDAAAASRLANGAHELRNPPGAITSGVEVLRRLADSTDARVDETAARVAPDRAVRAARR